MALRRECYIHSLKKNGVSAKGMATIICQIGDNDYLARYGKTKCHAIYNPFVGMYYVDDVYGIVKGDCNGEDEGDEEDEEDNPND